MIARALGAGTNTIARCQKLRDFQRGSMLRLLLAFSATLFAVSLTAAQTPIDIQPAKQLERTNTLGTGNYKPTDKEKPFFSKLAADEQVTGSAFVGPYKLQGRKGKYVSWFAIVRGISPVDANSHTVHLLLEQKHFDGLTDSHIMLVAFTGSGDFRATLEGDPSSIPALSLVRVYGRVTAEENNLPEITVEYIRVWPWLSFTFTDLGSEDHTNPRWTKFCTACKKGGRVYNPFPKPDYFRSMLGDPNLFGLNLSDPK
jgi:hypothetical protein